MKQKQTQNNTTQEHAFKVYNLEQLDFLDFPKKKNPYYV